MSLAGYGLKVSIQDRDHYFKRSWKAVFIEIPSGNSFITAEASVAKKSFWGPTCRQMICRDVGRWLRDEGYAPWADGSPPKFEVELVADRRFRLRP